MDTTWWWERDREDAHQAIFEKVQAVESAQADLYERFLRLACLYDPHEALGHRNGVEGMPGRTADVAENVVASNVDTVAAIIAKWAGRAVFMTEDGDWSTQRQAMALERYATGLVKKAKVHETGPRVFKDGAIMGTGVAKVFEREGAICVERVLPDEIIVDESECRTGKPRQLFHRTRVDRDVLKALFPEAEDDIDRAHLGTDGAMRQWAGWLPFETNEIILLEAYRLPIGRKGKKGYKPGRRVLAIEGKTLEDEDYERTKFPFAIFRWSPRLTGWYGRGLAEDIAGHQRQINILNKQETAILDQQALPTTWVPYADAKIMETLKVSKVGRALFYKGQAPPQTVTPQGLTNQLAARREQLKASTFESSGVSRLAAHGMKPAGLESAVAQREYQDITTERFALQEKAYERWFLDVVELMLEIAKEMGEDAPVIFHRNRFQQREITWADVDMGDVEVQIQAASSLAKTFAGRAQTVIEWAQAGVINQDEARSLMQHPDLESAMSLYTAAMEDIDRCIEACLDDEPVMPEPYQNLKMGIWRFQMSYLKALNNGAPEETLENLRTWIVQATKMLDMSGMGAAGPMPMGPGAPPQAPMDPMAPPMGPAPTSALAGGGVAPMPL
jgi:hypothetical protein